MEQLMMLRFSNAPVACSLPEGYEIRACRDGSEEDAAGWISACETLNEGLWTENQFRRDMLEDPDCGAGNIFLICRSENGEIAGTATAKDGLLPTLHMVGMKREYMGRGLSLPVCAAAVNRMIENGAHRIQLRTDEFRIPAIRTYLRMGFRPWYYMEDMQGRWRTVFRDMGLEPEDYYAYDGSSFRRIGI